MLTGVLFFNAICITHHLLFKLSLAIRVYTRVCSFQALEKLDYKMFILYYKKKVQSMYYFIFSTPKCLLNFKSKNVKRKV